MMVSDKRSPRLRSQAIDLGLKTLKCQNRLWPIDRSPFRTFSSKGRSLTVANRMILIKMPNLPDVTCRNRSIVQLSVRKFARLLIGTHVIYHQSADGWSDMPTACVMLIIQTEMRKALHEKHGQYINIKENVILHAFKRKMSRKINTHTPKLTLS